MGPFIRTVMDALGAIADLAGRLGGGGRTAADTAGVATAAADTAGEDPRRSLQHWFGQLERHRLNGDRAEFERLAAEMRRHFNVQAEDWTTGKARGGDSLEAYPHVCAQLAALWRKPGCAALLESLIVDNREGTRDGFPLPVAEEILLLIAILHGDQ